MKNGSSATHISEVETLISALFDGTITQEQFHLLQVYLRISASSRQLYIQQRNLHGALAAACAYEVLPTHSFPGMHSRDAKRENAKKSLVADQKSESSGKKAAIQRKEDHAKTEPAGAEPLAGGFSVQSSQTKTKAGIKISAPAQSDKRATLASREHDKPFVFESLDIATRHVTATSLSIASLVMLFVLMVMAMLTPAGQEILKRLAQTEPSKAGSIARITKVHNVEWFQAEEACQEGAKLSEGQRLRLVSGLIEIKSNQGVLLMLEGPAEFEMSALGLGQLDSGKLTANVPANAIGYTIDTPHIRVTDLGTEFGVEVDPEEHSEVHVFQGQVEAQWLGKSGSGEGAEKMNLIAGYATRFELNSLPKMPIAFASDQEKYQHMIAHPTTEATRLVDEKKKWRKSNERMRLDPDLVLYYTFAGEGSLQRAFFNQGQSSRFRYRCIARSRDELQPGFRQTVGKWPWSAALKFDEGSGSYLQIEDEASPHNTHISIGSAMSLIVTIGSLGETVEGPRGKLGYRAFPNKESAETGTAQDVRAILHGPVVMNRHRQSGDYNFQLAIVPSSDWRGRHRVEFRIQSHGEDTVTQNSRLADGRERTDGLAREILLSAEVDLNQQTWHDVVVVCDQQSVRLYWDGQPVEEQLLENPLSFQLEELFLGHGVAFNSDGSTSQAGFAGRIDDLAVMQRSLSELEIQSMAH